MAQFVRQLDSVAVDATFISHDFAMERFGRSLVAFVVRSYVCFYAVVQLALFMYKSKWPPKLNAKFIRIKSFFKVCISRNDRGFFFSKWFSLSRLSAPSLACCQCAQLGTLSSRYFTSSPLCWLLISSSGSNMCFTWK